MKEIRKEKNHKDVIYQLLSGFKNTPREKCNLFIYLSISQAMIYQSPETEAHDYSARRS